MNRRRFLGAAAGAAVVAGGGAYAWSRATGSASDYADQVAAMRAPLGEHPGLEDLVRHAALAANSHNTQAWRFALAEHRIAILADPARRTPVVDPDDHHLFVSLGCAAENLAIAAAASGRPGEVTIEPGDGSAVRFDFTAGSARTDPLAEAIRVRQSTRAEFDGRGIGPVELAALEASAAEPGVNTVMITDEAARGRLRDLIVAGNDAQMADKAFMDELKKWIRFSPRSAIASGDGLFSGASGNPSLPDAVGRLAFPLVVTAGAEGDRYARQAASTPVFAVLFAGTETSAHWVAVGRACQRLLLTATTLGIRSAFVNQPVEVPPLRPDLAALAGAAGRRPDLVLRLGYGPVMPYSPRRPVEAVLAASV